MTAQNLEVYETFQAPGASFVRHCKIRHLTIASNGRHERPKVDQYVPYRIDAPSKKPLVHDLGPAVSSVFLSVGRRAASSCPGWWGPERSGSRDHLLSLQASPNKQDRAASASIIKPHQHAAGSEHDRSSRLRS
jgi:hypothetical protein